MLYLLPKKCIDRMKEMIYLVLGMSTTKFAVDAVAL
jgi:hypothetical protein